MAWSESQLTALVGSRHPIVQAPMAGATTPALAAAVSNAGAIGSLGAAMLGPDALRDQIRETRALTDGPFGVNLFVPVELTENVASVEAMREALSGWRERLGVAESGPAPATNPPFDDQVEVVLEARPALFSFTFGVPPADRIDALRDAGIAVAGTATTADEAVVLEAAGCDLVVAQGSEAGGHRGTFSVDFDSALIGLVALVPEVVDRIGIPVAAAGGIMDGRGIAAALALGAAGAQLGTAFVACEESAVAELYLGSLEEAETVVTRAFTGRPARGLRSGFFDEIEHGDGEIPPYPQQRFLTGELRRAAIEGGELAPVVRLAGQGVRRARGGRAGALVEELVAETTAALERLAR